MILTVIAVKGTLQSDVLSFIDTIQPEISIGRITLILASMLHLLMICGEVSLTHGTAHSRLAVWEMVSGRYRIHFWIGTVLSFAAVVILIVPRLVAGVQIGLIIGSLCALIGMMLYEHAYVQAGQSVPLA
jgi:hypothetical protein